MEVGRLSCDELHAEETGDKGRDDSGDENRENVGWPNPRRERNIPSSLRTV